MSFTQLNYEVNEESVQIEVGLVLSSPLSFDITATISNSPDYYYYATGESFMYELATIYRSTKFTSCTIFLIFTVS